MKLDSLKPNEQIVHQMTTSLSKLEHISMQENNSLECKVTFFPTCSANMEID